MPTSAVAAPPGRRGPLSRAANKGSASHLSWLTDERALDHRPSLGLWLAAIGRDRFEAWIDATILPPCRRNLVEGWTATATSCAPILWRRPLALALPPDKVDPTYSGCCWPMRTSGSRPFRRDLRSMTRAVLQAGVERRSYRRLDPAMQVARCWKRHDRRGGWQAAEDAGRPCAGAQADQDRS